MIANFKGKQNTSGFHKNPQNINRKGRPTDIISKITVESLKNGEIMAGMQETYEYIMKRGEKLSIRELLNIQRLTFARYYYMTGGDMKKYCKVMKI